MLLLIAATAVADTKESETEIDADAEHGPWISDVDSNLYPEEEYNIYKKPHHENPCDRSLDTYDYEEFWYDSTQVYINSKFCEPALWFDNFFANDQVFNEGAAGTYIRWRNDFSYDEEDYFKYKMRLTASVELPGMENHLRLTFESDENEDLRDIAPGNGDETTNSLGVQLDFIKNARSKFNVSINFKPRIRFRYRYTLPIYETITLRLTQEVQREKSVHSAKTRFDFEKLFNEAFLLRITTEGEVSEEYDGTDWLQAFVLYQRINKKTSLSYETSVKGVSKPRWQAIDYRLAIRFRKNFHREWLFYEISPEMTWPITYDDDRLLIEQDRRSKWQLFFRLEVHFGNANKKTYQDYNKITKRLPAPERWIIRVLLGDQKDLKYQFYPGTADQVVRVYQQALAS